MPKLADKVGSLLFCPDCGTLLNLPQDGDTEVTCEQCGHEEPASCTIRKYRDHNTFTPRRISVPLRQKGKTQTKVHEANEALLKVTEKCPECGHMEAYSQEAQLRSADEGSTIFYTCVKCKHGWRVNN